jgi:hypothetical protein
MIVLIVPTMISLSAFVMLPACARVISGELTFLQQPRHVSQRAKLLIHLTRCVSSPWRLDLDVGAFFVGPYRR